MCRMMEIVEKYGAEYMLRQLAEECTELAQASLKLIRSRRKETPMREDEATEKFMEEMADVSLMMQMVFDCMLTPEMSKCIGDIYERKENRMYDRMLGGKMEEDVW